MPATFIALALLQAAPFAGQHVESMLSDHGWGRPARDGALDAVAERLADRLAGPVDAPPPETATEQLRFLLARGQVSDAIVYPFTLRHRAPGDLQRALPKLLGRFERQHPPTHYGLATVKRGDALTSALLMVHRGARLEQPLPRTARPGAKLRVRGELRRGYFGPKLLLAPPTGAVRELKAGQGRTLDATFALPAAGVYGVELVADSQYGPVVLHNQKVHVGRAPPELPVLRARPPESRSPARALFALINARRARAGLPRLHWHPTLAQVAGEHADDMAKRRALIHVSPDSGTLDTRIRARGLVATRVAENLAHAADAHAALQAFEESPGHKRNLLIPELSHVGVAVSGEYFSVALARLAR